MEDQLAATLAATLDPDNATRSQAETQLEAFRSPANDPSGQLGVALVNLLLQPSVAPHIRQSAGLALRKFITTRWSPYFDAFLGSPAADVHVKSHIRSALLQGLADSNRKIRLATSYAISTIAGPDYPDQYPELLPHLQQLLTQQNPDAIHGAMALLSEFVKVEMDEVQLMQVAREILPTLETVLADEQRLSPHIRARCILVFRQCLTTLYMVKESYPDVVKQATENLLPRWLGAMQSLLSKDAATELDAGGRFAGWQSLALRNEIFKTLKVAAMFRTQFKPYLNSLVQLALANLASLLPAFSQVHLSSIADVDPPTADEGDDDVAADIPSLACSVFDFVTEASRRDRCRHIFLSGGTGGAGIETEALSQLIGLLLVYVDMTHEDEENWANDANAFIADEDDETIAYSLRIAAADLLATLIEDYPMPMLRCLGVEIEKRIQHGNEAKARGEPDWWKSHEGILAAVGNNADAVTEIIESQSSVPLNIESIFQNVVLPNVGDDAPPFLQGRGFVFASQFASMLPSELAVQFLEAAVHAIDSETATMPVKISAVRTIKNFYRHLPSKTVSPFAPRIIRQLGPLLAQASEDTLVLVVETIQAVVIEDEDAAHSEGPLAPVVEPEIIGSIVQAALQIWAPNARDVILLSVISDLFESLAGSKQQGVPKVVVQRAIPTLAAAIVSQQDSDEPSALAETAVELSNSILAGADGGALHGVVNVLCPNLVHVLKTSDDRDVQQRGIECLTQLVRKCPTELLAWHDGSAVDELLQIIARQLSPTDSSESGGLAVGDFVVALLRNAREHIAPVLPQLLDAMVQRLASAQTATFIQSLIVPIAYLMHNDDAQANQVMDLLQGVVVASAEQSQSGSGLEVLLRKWADNAETVHGFWAQRVTALALTKVIQSRRPLLFDLTVNGDLIPDTSGLIRTRSRAKSMPDQYTQIPLVAKLTKILLREWANASYGGGPSSRARTPDTDDEDGEWDDEPGQSKMDEMAFLSDMLGPGGLEALDSDETEDDEEFKNDPVYQMDVKAYLGTFIRSLATGTDAATFQQSAAGHLTQEESGWLRSLVA